MFRIGNFLETNNIMLLSILTEIRDVLILRSFIEDGM